MNRTLFLLDRVAFAVFVAFLVWFFFWFFFGIVIHIWSIHASLMWFEIVGTGVGFILAYLRIKETWNDEDRSLLLESVWTNPPWR